MNAPFFISSSRILATSAVGLTCMDNQRQAGFARRRNMGAKPLRLRRARAQVIVIIQPRLTDANYLRMLCQLNKVIHGYIKLFMRMVRMGSYSTENIRVFVCNLEQLLKLPHARANRDHKPNASSFSVCQDRRQTFSQPFIVKVAVAIDNKKAQVLAGVSPSST